MWFKNLRIYRLTQAWTLDQESLQTQMAEQAFVPCQNQDTAKVGWTSAAGKMSEDLVFNSGKYMLVCMKKQEKILPATVVNEMLAEKVELIEQEESRKLYRKERETLKEDIVFELLPRAFKRSRTTHAYIDTQRGFIVVNSGSANAADELLNLLRESLGSLPVIPLNTKEEPIRVMTHWLQSQEVYEGFTLGGECELQDPLNNQNSIRCKKQELSNGEIEPALAAGKHVTQLSLCWEERISALICDDFAIKRIKFEDVLNEELSNNNDGHGDDDYAKFEGGFLLMAMELDKFVSAVCKVFGGIDEEV